ncbi:Hypothetical protein Nlim_1631 [Candidatus Nitrosarchaeum limnium SFB1]|uniref:Uncharacterized protein n=1 Tax=Candidatus Nitrosarchaeum limnium SFB1 TaxID=886738 RepID=F3KM84_9ARCH|nr:Hypothetical protein Nlim_1631 [Candidatus Nitrosarchaeum limnium SFB1]
MKCFFSQPICCVNKSSWTIFALNHIVRYGTVLLVFW